VTSFFVGSCITRLWWFILVAWFFLIKIEYISYSLRSKYPVQVSQKKTCASCSEMSSNYFDSLQPLAGELYILSSCWISMLICCQRWKIHCNLSRPWRHHRRAYLNIRPNDMLVQLTNVARTAYVPGDDCQLPMNCVASTWVQSKGVDHWWFSRPTRWTVTAP
jgi:hypothetical protein